MTPPIEMAAILAKVAMRNGRCTRTQIAKPDPNAAASETISVGTCSSGMDAGDLARIAATTIVPAAKKAMPRWLIPKKSPRNGNRKHWIGRYFW